MKVKADTVTDVYEAVSYTHLLEELIEFWANYESCVNGFIATYQQAEVS